MEVTRSTLLPSLPAISAALAECEFYAVDTELTGLYPSKDGQTAMTDTIQQRYSKMRDAVKAIIITQMGVSTFKFDKEKKIWLASTWNFWIFPLPYGGIAPVFVCEADSLNFLAKNKFDFNKFVYEGIPYLDQFSQKKKRPDLTKVDSLTIPTVGEPVVLIASNDLSWWTRTEAQINEWFQNKGEKELTISCPGFLRKFLYQELPKKYGAQLWLDTVDEKFIIVKTPSEEDRAAKKAEKGKRLMAEYEAAVGFGHVMNMLIESKKPIVGHNCLFDMLHMYEHFYEFLPYDVRDWKRNLNKIFPCIIDTKYIGNHVPEIKPLLPSTSLEELHTHLLTAVPIKIEHAPKFDRYGPGSSYAHEAGYDAWMTGCVLIRLLALLEAKRSNNEVDLNASLPSYLLLVVQNRLNLMRSDVTLNITAEQPECSFAVAVASRRLWTVLLSFTPLVLAIALHQQ